ncbi:hypothetical protein M2113_000511 [Aurantimicrobium minutum]|uniref:ATP-grasp fold amidoligase family protein n=1 Tax=Aurantimicrobium minutum TaxID=708131 RepID=UPI0024764BDB|nr:ATP-grasp fold amidoligase family protein [Aurantimicrobium minutum]MDH6409562.1 hypothetical protein [Aurantimicrobium minutum]
MPTLGWIEKLRAYSSKLRSAGPIALPIAFKWRFDSLFLPLESSQRTLYDTIHKLFWQELRSFPNLIKPKDFNSKIQWLKLFDQKPEIVTCTDKYLVRNFVEDRVGPDYLTKLYAVLDKPELILNLQISKDVVIKTNHDSGTVFLLKRENSHKFSKLVEPLKLALSKTYGHLNGEWAYAYIKPKILVEEYLDSEAEYPPADFKFHCVDGRVQWLQYIFERGINTKEVIVDPLGKAQNIHFDHHLIHVNEFQIPENWDELIRVAEELSRGFKYVRVDLYNVAGRIVFGEMTFFPLMGCYPGQGQKKLGKLLNFSLNPFDPYESSSNQL